MHPVDPRSAECLAEDYRRRRKEGPDQPRARRKAAVEVGMLVFDVWAAVYLSGVLVARIAHVDALLWGGVSGACAGACFAVFRWQVPARVRSRDEKEDEPESDEDGGWDLSGLIIYAVCVPFLMLFGFLVRGWFLVAIVLGFALAADAATLLGVVLAVACSIVASACAEYAVVHPLFRRWDIALD